MVREKLISTLGLGGRRELVSIHAIAQWEASQTSLKVRRRPAEHKTPIWVSTAKTSKAVTNSRNSSRSYCTIYHHWMKDTPHRGSSS
jgi:hypothetical protein